MLGLIVKEEEGGIDMRIHFYNLQHASLILCKGRGYVNQCFLLCCFNCLHYSVNVDIFATKVNTKAVGQ